VPASRAGPVPIAGPSRERAGGARAPALVAHATPSRLNSMLPAPCSGATRTHGFCGNAPAASRDQVVDIRSRAATLPRPRGADGGARRRPRPPEPWRWLVPPRP
jgi:hypothetical protein